MHDFLWLWLSIPDVALALFFAGILAVYAEFCSPGSIVPGVAGSVLILLSAAALAPFAVTWWGATLTAFALTLFLLEAGCRTRGWLTAAGAAALFAGLLLLLPGPEPRIHPATAAGIAIPFAAISSFLFSLAVRARRNKTGPESLS